MYRFYYDMTEEGKKLLSIFDVRFQDLIYLCEARKSRIAELESLLAQKEEELQTALQTIRDLNIKCDNLLTARIVSVNETEVRNAKMRLSKMVREIDKCIALLNE